ncbi:MAG: GTP pyrophosphokinase family protein [Clostridiales bacterium]|nr:GTP pyrophosphokinase family protein [Clostridiales bacterium]
MKSDDKQLTFEKLISSNDPEEFLESTIPFQKLMMQYRCAMLEVQTKFEVINNELSLYGDRNPIEFIKSRIKRPVSIMEKMKRKGFDISIDSIQNNIYDIAGIRVVCSFPEDIYRLAEKICMQDDIKLLNKKDYIKNPKPNGYRSLHLILEVPVFFTEEKKRLPVEVQLRTIAMDFWASIEHKLRYKKNLPETVSADIAESLRSCSDKINEMDFRMQAINRWIELSKTEGFSEEGTKNNN